MRRFKIWFGLSGLISFLACFAIATYSSEGSRPSSVALAYGYPDSPYSDAEFSISDDAVEMVLKVTVSQGSHLQSMSLYGDGRLLIRAGNEIYTRLMDRSRMVEIFRSAVDNGLAEFDFDVVMDEIPGAICPEGSAQITTQLRFTSYERVAGDSRAYVSEKASLCAPELFPQVAQSQALIDLAAMLETELAMAQREGSAKTVPRAPFKEALFQLSNDPEEVTLRWGVGGGMVAGRGQSLTLYGDGRLQLSPHPGEIFTRHLTSAEMEELVRVAVDHGLAEWDDERVRFSLSPGLAQRYPDAVHTTGEIYLDSYSRGAYVRAPLHRSFSLRNASMTLKESPHVLELQGLEALAVFARDQFQQAREEESNE